MSVGRSPLVGLIATYAAVGGGFSANILLNSLDVLLAGITEQAAKMVDPNYIGNPTMNYYFLIASTFLLVGLATWVTVKFVEPRFSKYDGKVEAIAEITSAEKRGLKWAGITVFAYIAILLIAVIPENGWLRDAETGSLSIVHLCQVLYRLCYSYSYYQLLLSALEQRRSNLIKMSQIKCSNPLLI